MATAGFAVGLGNIWRFPYVAGMNGGGAFLLVYLGICFLIALPLLTIELSLGRRTQRSPIAGMLALIPEDQALLRAAETIYLVATSPEFAYQR